MKSLILIAPPSYSLRSDITVGEKLRVLGGFLTRKTVEVQAPVADHQFTTNSEKQRFIEGDPLRLLRMTGKFCLESWKLDRRVERNLSSLTLPVLVLLAQNDAVVDNQKVLQKFVPRLPPGRVAVEICPGSHYLFFEPQAPRVIDRILWWMACRGEPVARPG